MNPARLRNLLTGLLASTLLLTGCAGQEDRGTTAQSNQDQAVGHIHGLGIDPADGALYVATHFGLFRVDDTGEATRVADRWQDTMAFTIIGPSRFLGSGHPDPREDLPPHLGLIESTDAGQTWEPLALQGEADFHILEQVGDNLYAYDATSGRLLVTQDHTTFHQVARTPMVSLTPDPAQPRHLLATTDRGQVLKIDVATGKTTEPEAPPLLLLETTPEGDVVALDPTGTIQISRDAGNTWTPRGGIGDRPAALTITDDAWYAATEQQVFRSDDDGATWTRVL